MNSPKEFFRLLFVRTFKSIVEKSNLGEEKNQMLNFNFGYRVKDTNAFNRGVDDMLTLKLLRMFMKQAIGRVFGKRTSRTEDEVPDKSLKHND